MLHGRMQALVQVPAAVQSSGYSGFGADSIREASLRQQGGSLQSESWSWTHGDSS